MLRFASPRCTLRPSRSPKPSRLMALWLVAALLWAQWLGMVHQELHPAVGATTHVHGSAPAPSRLHLALERLLGHHADGLHAADCRLYDQISHADTLPGAAVALALPAAWPWVRLAEPALQSFENWRAWFDARGPPNLS